MSNVLPIPPQPPPTPSPTPATPAWMNILVVVLTAIAGILAGPHVIPGPDGGGGGKVVPPTPPGPTPAPPTPAPPQPQPPPSPVPPFPQPLPPSPSPVGVVSVTDSAGRQVRGTVDAGTLFVAAVPQGAQIIGILQPNASFGDIADISDTRIVCTLKAGGSLQIIAYASGSKPTVMSVTCNQAPQPPPTPVPPTPIPDPTPPAPPQPTPPKAKNVSIAIVEDDSNRSADVAKLFSNLTSWESLANAGVTWTRYDLRDTSTTAAMAKQALTSAGVTVNNVTAGYVIYDRDTKAVIYSSKLFNLDDVKAHVQVITGRTL